MERNPRERVSADAPPANVPRPADAVQLADPGLTAEPPDLVSNRNVAAQRRHAVEPAIRAERDLLNRERLQYQQRQLDEFRAEHKDRIHAWSGAEQVGSVVAAAVGEAIVHIGRQEFVSVPLPDGAPIPDVGTSVSVDRTGTLTQNVPERGREHVMERSFPERSL